MTLDKIDKILQALGKSDKPYSWFMKELESVEELEGLEFDEDMLKLLGFGVFLTAENNFTLKSKHTKIKDEIFCVVDIESNSSFKRGGQIIEIGAYKIKNSKIIDSFHSLIKTNYLPQNIKELTGIDETLLKNAPSLASVLNDFRLFLGDSIFVAHNVSFDYNFISNSLHKCGFGILCNQKLCTLELSRRIIDSEKYGLNSLKEILNIQNAHHRALSDAKSAAEVLKHCISKLPFYISSTQDLINFSKSNIKKYKIT